MDSTTSKKEYSLYEKGDCILTNHNGGDNNLSECLRQLVSEACSYPAKSPQRQKILNNIIKKVTESRKLWRKNTPYYDDALCVTWQDFCRNPEKYDPEASSLITWLSRYLRWRLADFHKKEADSQATRAFPRRPRNEETNDLIDPIDELVAEDDISLALEIEKETYNWVQTDKKGKLRKTIFRGCPEINAQVLILRRLPPETSWEDIAKEFGFEKDSAEAKDLPKFYSRKCFPLLREFGSDQGYL